MTGQEIEVEVMEPASADTVAERLLAFHALDAEVAKATAKATARVIIASITGQDPDPAPRGRPGYKPSRLTPEIRGAFLESIRQGLGVKPSAQKLRIAWSTIQAWKARDPEFSAEIQAARAEWEARMVAAVTDYSEKVDGRLALEALGRRYPERWGRQDRVTVRGELKINSSGHPLGLPADLRPAWDRSMRGEATTEDSQAIRAFMASGGERTRAGQIAALRRLIAYLESAPEPSSPPALGSGP